MHKLPVPRQAEHHTSPQGCTWNKSIASKLYNCNMKKIIGHIEIIESYHVISNLPNLFCSLGPCWLKHLARMEFSHGKICPRPGFPVEQTPLRFCKGDSSPNSFCLWLRVFLRRLVSVPNSYRYWAAGRFCFESQKWSRGNQIVPMRFWTRWRARAKLSSSVFHWWQTLHSGKWHSIKIPNTRWNNCFRIYSRHSLHLPEPFWQRKV
jgi:hypothetical protein